MTTVREPFKKIYGFTSCYCRSPLPRSNPIDHVLPWIVGEN